MSSFEELLKNGKKILEGSGITEAGLDAWLLLEYVTGKNRAWYFAHSDEMADSKEAIRYQELIRKRSSHIPLQHLTHQAFFMGYEFYVDQHVLVPRQDTEVLVETALEAMQGRKDLQILDMCTGSGCILFSLLLEKPDSTGTGVDLSLEALEVARRNRRQLELDGRAELLQSDLFSAKEFKDGRQYDILISNPPYIPTKEIDTLMEEVKSHDPRLALDGHEDGLYFYRKICTEGRIYLKKGGWLLFEIGCDQGKDVAELMEAAGFSEVQRKKDLSGLDRVVFGKW